MPQRGKIDAFPPSNKFSGLIFSDVTAWHSSGIFFCGTSSFLWKGCVAMKANLFHCTQKNILSNVSTALLYLCSSFHKAFLIKITRDSRFSKLSTEEIILMLFFFKLPKITFERVLVTFLNFSFACERAISYSFDNRIFVGSHWKVDALSEALRDFVDDG